LFRVDMDETVMGRVQELLHTETFLMTGLAMQTYLVPTADGGEDMQRRLFTSVAQYGAAPASEISIVRINLNSLEALHAEKEGPVEIAEGTTEEGTTSTWENLTKPVLPSKMTAITYSRLAYGNGKLYYMNMPYNNRAILVSTDVTILVDCPSVMALILPIFESWPVHDDQIGKVHEASEHPEFALLHETSPFAAALPWQFNAYRKVVQLGDYLVLKEVLCSKPKPPTTRPSKEGCCTNKRVIAANTQHALPENACSLMQTMQQL